MFVDASAIVAILALEPDGPDLIAALDRSGSNAVTSPVAVFEATLALSRILQCRSEEALRRVEELLARTPCVVVNVGAETARLAIDAHARYGKGTGHPAKLNMGDCFAYACAKAHGVSLLYKGDDFAHTDLA